jgi:hypothetical protein
MKKLFCFQGIFVILILAHCTSIKKSPFEGAWICVSAKWDAPNDSGSMSPSDKYIKLITKTYFISIDQDTSKKEAVYSCGKYAFDGKIYTETIECFKNPKFIGHSISYKSKLNGNTWELSGTYKLKEWGVSDHNYEAYELWKKIE